MKIQIKSLKHDLTNVFITLIGLKFGDEKNKIVFNFKKLTNVLCSIYLSIYLSMCDVFVYVYTV